MIALKKNIKIHVKNNRWKEGSFPNTPEGEKVFTITEERVKKALNNFPHLEERFETGIPVPEAITTVAAAANVAAKPRDGVSWVIPVPIVAITL